ncbi:MAG: hypothetical protein IJK86_01875 [Lachnospiraceae bacterium]|nr:hypothetical protein [Lachnospiraceae bacterium]
MNRIIIVILCLALLLTACSRTDPSDDIGGTLPVLTLDLRQTTPGNTQGEETDAPGTEFTEEELNRLNGFLNWHFNRIACMFLTCSYERPEEIDFDLVFYNGTSSSATSEPVPDAEKEAVAKALGQEEVLAMGLIAVQKRPRTRVEELIRTYTGLPAETAAQIRLSYPFVEEYDAYYTFFQDAEVIYAKAVKAIWMDEEHTLAQVRWTDRVRDRAGTAVMEKTEEGWRFVSNRIER